MQNIKQSPGSQSLVQPVRAHRLRQRKIAPCENSSSTPAASECSPTVEGWRVKRGIYTDWAFQRDVLILIIRAWSFDLSPLELCGVMFVYDRTLGWDKEWEIITRDQACRGVWSQDGLKLYAPPISKDRNRACSVLKRLIAKGFLLRKAKGKFFMYALNLDYLPSRLRQS